MTSATAAVARDAPVGKLVPGAAGVRVTNPPDYVMPGDRLPLAVKFTAKSNGLEVRAVRVSLVGTSESETLRPNSKGLGTVRGYLHPRRSAHTYTVRYRIYLGHDKHEKASLAGGHAARPAALTRTPAAAVSESA